MNGHDETSQSRKAGQRHREQQVDGDGVERNRPEDCQRVDPSLDLDFRDVRVEKFDYFLLLLFLGANLDRLGFIFSEIMLEKDIVKTKINIYSIQNITSTTNDIFLIFNYN